MTKSENESLRHQFSSLKYELETSKNKKVDKDTYVALVKDFDQTQEELCDVTNDQDALKP